MVGNGDATKEIYTTGEVARICNISQQTVIRCFDSGRLRGFRVPGSRFRRIPRDALIQFMRENKIPLQHLEPGKKRILVVDDDEAIVEMLTELLERDGRFNVRAACSGFDAGLMCDQFAPVLMLLDFKLPDVNGNVVCRGIRANPKFDHMKIIIVSGVADPDEVAQLMAAGADEFIKKPFQMDVLISRIASLLALERSGAPEAAR